MALIDRPRATLLGLLGAALIIATLSLGAGTPTLTAPHVPAAGAASVTEPSRSQTEAPSVAGPPTDAYDDSIPPPGRWRIR